VSIPLAGESELPDPYGESGSCSGCGRWSFPYPLNWMRPPFGAGTVLGEPWEPAFAFGPKEVALGALGMG
jgi:hypothetical protein